LAKPIRILTEEVAFLQQFAHFGVKFLRRIQQCARRVLVLFAEFFENGCHRVPIPCF
jgi:hypothetical protein